MIQYEELSRTNRDVLEDNIAMRDRTIYESLYYYLNGRNAPYEGYHADGVLSPREASHNEYFPLYKTNAIKTFNEWKPKLEALGGDDVFVFLVRVKKYLLSAGDMVELTWAAIQLHKLVSLHNKQQRTV